MFKINFDNDQSRIIKWILIVAISFIVMFLVIKISEVIFRDTRTYEQKLEDRLVDECDSKTGSYQSNKENDKRFVECINGVEKYMEDRTK